MTLMPITSHSFQSIVLLLQISFEEKGAKTIRVTVFVSLSLCFLNPVIFLKMFTNSLSLSLSLSLCSSVPFLSSSLSLSLCLSVYFSLLPTLSLSLFIYSFSLFLSLSLCLSVYFSLSSPLLSLSLFISSFSLFLSLSLSLSLSVYQFISLSSPSPPLSPLHIFHFYAS